MHVAARVRSRGQCECLSHSCGMKAHLTVPVAAGCQGGLAEDIGGCLAQLCSHVMCDPGQTPAPLGLLRIPGLRSDNGPNSWGCCADETKAGTEMLRKCRLCRSFVYSLIHSLQGVRDTSIISTLGVTLKW